MTSSLSSYVGGLAELALLLGALYFGAVRLRGRLLPGWSGAPARLAEIVLAIAELVLTLELLGLLSLYRPGIVLVGGIAAGLAIGWLAGPAAEGKGPPSPDVGLVVVAIATIAATMVAAHWAFPTQAGLDVGMYLPNSTWHNMPFAARFVQDHHVGSLLFTEPLKLSVWFYPQNSELLHSVGILFVDNDFISPLINMGWLAGCLLAAWCIGRPYGVGAAAVVGVALICDANMLLLYQPGDAKNDTMGLFFLLAAAAVLINGEAELRKLAKGPPVPVVGELTQTYRFGTGPLIVAALAAGLAMGTKINLLAPLAALTIGVIVVSTPVERLRNAGIWAGGLLLGGGFWFIRNLIEAGNPLPWINKGPLPGPDQLDIYVREPHNVADYLTNWTVIKDWFIPGLHNDFGGLWPVVLGLVLGGIVLVIWRAETPTTRMLGIVAGIAALAYLVTPLTAAGNQNAPTGFERNVRYLSPALAIGIALLPLLPQLRSGRRPQIVLGVFSLLLLESVLTSNQWAHPGYRQGAIALALVLIVVPVATTIALRMNVPRILVAAALVIVAIGSLTYGRERENDYLSGRYQPETVPDQLPNGIPEAMAATNALHDQRIAIGGSEAGFKQYLFYGRDLSNHVQYLGHHGPHGTFRPITSCAEFRRALDDGNYGYVVIAPSHLAPYSRPAEVTWVEPDPNSQLVETFFNVSVYKLNGPLDPAGCAALTPDQRTTDPLLEEHS
ncbi:MAG: hypothetical protein ACXWDQ_04785 [Solirubrobacterales bacterium]